MLKYTEFFLELKSGLVPLAKMLLVGTKLDLIVSVANALGLCRCVTPGAML